LNIHFIHSPTTPFTPSPLNVVERDYCRFPWGRCEHLEQTGLECAMIHPPDPVMEEAEQRAAHAQSMLEFSMRDRDMTWYFVHDILGLPLPPRREAKCPRSRL
jgi:hypothetical protein